MKLHGVRWNKITLVGVGLLGGSLGLAVKKRRLARQVAPSGLDGEVLGRSLRYLHAR